VSEVWAPTTYVRDAWVRSGLPSDLVHVIPYGVDSEVFSPNVPPSTLLTDHVTSKSTFKFLFNRYDIYCYECKT